MLDVTQGWIVGKMNMLEYCRRRFGFHSWQSVRYWRRKYKFPLRYLPNGVPYLIESEVILWAAKWDEIRRGA